jgi:hypothetical protein
MPRSFYMLTVIVAVGYFSVMAGHPLMFSLRARYREATSEHREPSGGGLVPAASFSLRIGGVFDFCSRRLWWWLAPALSILAMLIGLVVYTREAVIAVTPFIYTLF